MKKLLAVICIFMMSMPAFALDLGKFSLGNTVRVLGSDDDKRPTRFEYKAHLSVKNVPVWIDYTHRTDVGDKDQENTGYNQYTIGYDIIKQGKAKASIVYQQQNYTDNKDTVNRLGLEIKF